MDFTRRRIASALAKVCPLRQRFALIYQLPRRARRTPLRGGSDFMRLLSLSPKAMVMCSGLHEDWAPWLRQFVPDLEVRKVTTPWDPGLLAVRPHFNHLDAPDLLAHIVDFDVLNERWRWTICSNRSRLTY
jgi:hypothetical protein